MRQSDDFIPIHFYATAPYECSYLPDHTARSQVALPEPSSSHPDEQPDLSITYGTLVSHGFRRSGTFIYRPYCDDCQSCLPVRLPVERFTPSRNQRRTWRQHANLATTELPLEFVEEHFALYRRYLSTRHPGGGMDDDNRDQYSQFLLQSPANTFLMEFRDGPTLRMVSIVDRLEDGYSSVYTFYDPDLKHASLGTYGILWQIEACRRLQLPYLYLGYWIAESRKMAYKTRFRPIENLTHGRWQPLVTV